MSATIRASPRVDIVASADIVAPTPVILFSFFLIILFVYLRTYIGQSVGNIVPTVVGIGLPTGGFWGLLLGVGYAVSLDFGVIICIVACATVCLINQLLIIIDALEKLKNIRQVVYSG